MSEVDELRRRVERAFAERAYPGDDCIADSDPRYPTYEGHAVTDFHRGKRWQEITLRHLRDDYKGDASACLAFMTPEGWRYYLPAYLLIALDWVAADAIGDAVAFGLTHPRARVESWTRVATDLELEPEAVLAAHSARFEDRLSGLDKAELVSARAVLAYIADLVDAENARLGPGLPNDARVALESWSPAKWAPSERRYTPSTPPT